jgi:hypothetical protein
LRTGPSSDSAGAREIILNSIRAPNENPPLGGLVCVQNRVLAFVTNFHANAFLWQPSHNSGLPTSSLVSGAEIELRQVPAPIVENCFGPVWDRMELQDGCK